MGIPGPGERERKAARLNSAPQVVRVLEVSQDDREQILVGIATGHAEDDAAHAQPDLRTDLRKRRLNPTFRAGSL